MTGCTMWVTGVFFVKGEKVSVAYKIPCHNAPMVELVDTLVLDTSRFMAVRVRLLLGAPLIITLIGLI